MIKKDLGAKDIKIVDGVAYVAWPLTFWQKVYLFISGRIYVQVRGYATNTKKAGDITFKLSMIEPEEVRGGN